MILLDTLAGQPIWLAILISLLVSIIIAIAGIIPSTFVTAANIIYFGFEGGLALSIIGEALGAIISFFLYRKGLKKLSQKSAGKRNPKLLDRLKDTSGAEAFVLVFLLRIFPFIPSGLVTLAASFSKMGTAAFVFSSTFGKIPALLIEAYSVHAVLGWEKEYQLAAAAFAAIVAVWYYYWTTRRKKRRMKNENI